LLFRIRNSVLQKVLQKEQHDELQSSKRISEIQFTFRGGAPICRTEANLALKTAF
jgi:hypothetical protein